MRPCSGFMGALWTLAGPWGHVLGHRSPHPGETELALPHPSAQCPSVSVKGSTEGHAVKNNTEARAGGCRGLSALCKQEDMDSAGL